MCTKHYLYCTSPQTQHLVVGIFFFLAGTENELSVNGNMDGAEYRAALEDKL